MPHVLSMTVPIAGFNSALIAQQIAGVLDLLGLTVGIWAVWSSITLPLGGHLQRAFRLIGFGALAFAISHIIETLVGSLHLLSDEDNFLLTQGTVLLSMLFFVPGLAGLADMLPTLPAARRGGALPRIWPLAIPLIFLVCAFSFILYGISPAGETAALILLEASISLLALFCVILLVRARIGGVIGRSLWMAMLGLLLFCLAHPLQAWLNDSGNLPSDLLPILHRLIVMPSLLLFALSITRLGRRLSAGLYPEPRTTLLLLPEAPSRPKRISVSARMRALQKREQERARNGSIPSRPFPVLHQHARQD